MGIEIDLTKKEILLHRIFLLLVIIVLTFVLCLCPGVTKSAFTQDMEEEIHPEGSEPIPPNYPEEGYTEGYPEEGYAEGFGDTAEIVEPEQTFQENGAKTQESKIEVEEEQISLDLKNIDIIELFRILSLKTGQTIVPSKRVKGRVNLFLNNVTFEDVLDVILITQGLACEQKGNILMVMTGAEYKARYGKEWDERRQFRSFKLRYAEPSAVFKVLSNLKSDIGKIIVDEASGTVILIDIPEKLVLMQEAVRELEQPLETEIFDLEYAKADDIKMHLTGAITPGAGELFVDTRTGKIAVSDLPEKMRKIKRMLEAFDEESQQVFIEAEILQIALKDEFQRGIDWKQLFEDARYHGLEYIGTFPVSPSFEPSPALSTANLQMTVGTLTSDYYTATLQLLQTFGDTKILSRPRIAVMNNEEAKIMVGAREAYVTQTLSQAETTTVTSESIDFIDVGVKLNVIPTINKEGFVTMKIKPEVSSVRETIVTSLGSRVPIVETSEAETVVKVKDGTIIMIAGLMKEEKREDVLGIPVLSRIPFLGALFGSRAKLNRKTELIVFLRPHIITGEVPLTETAPEKLIPPDVLPEDMKKSFISRELEKIRIAPPERLPEEAVETVTEKIPLPTEKKTAHIKIEDKLKGLKEY